MPDTNAVDVPIPIEAGVASALDDEATRALAGRLVSRILHPASVERLFEVIDALKADAHQRGLTDEIVDAELAAYNAERQELLPPA